MPRGDVKRPGENNEDDECRCKDPSGSDETCPRRKDTGGMKAKTMFRADENTGKESLGCGDVEDGKLRDETCITSHDTRVSLGCLYPAKQDNCGQKAFETRKTHRICSLASSSILQHHIVSEDIPWVSKPPS